MQKRICRCIAWALFAPFVIAATGRAQPAPLEVLSHWDGGSSSAVDVRDAVVFAGSDSSLVVLSAADPFRLKELGRLELSSHVHDIVVRGQVAYVAGTGGLKLAALDVSSPANPTLRDSVISDWGLHTGRHIVLRGDTAFVSVTPFSGSSMYDVSDPDDLRYLGALSSSVNDFALSDGAIYLMPSGLRALQQRVTNWAPMEFGSWDWFDEAGVMSGVEILEDRLYMVGDGFRIYQITSDSMLPALLGGMDLPEQRPSDLVLAHNLVYIAGAGDGLLVVDPAEPTSPEIIARFDTPSALDVAVKDTLIGLAAGDDGLYLLRDVTCADGECFPPVPVGPVLKPVAPNPASGSVTIRYRMPASERVRLVVHDVLGREIAVLTDATKPKGSHRLRWEAPMLPNGVYVVSLEVGSRRESRLFSVVR